MLVLSRNREGAIRIGDNITITVLDVQKRRVLLGIEAPNQVTIRRAELSRVDSSSHHCAAIIDSRPKVTRSVSTLAPSRPR